MNKKIMAALGGVLLLLSSCTSANQFYGVATGASLGGMFGSAIGGITGGPRGHDAGRLAGMAIGGVIGAVATAPKTQDGNYRSSDYCGDEEYSDYSYSPYSNLEIQNLRFVDNNESQTIDAGEHCKLVFEIRNVGNEFIYDIAPVITVTGTKQIYLSPTAIISELAPGRAMRYQAEVVATNKLKSGVAEFSIGFSNGDRIYTHRSFQLRTRGK